MPNFDPASYVYGDAVPDPNRRDLLGLKSRWIVDNLTDKPDPTVLDYGVGEGKHLRLIGAVRPSARLVGVDVKPPQANFGFDFRQIAPSGRLPFASDEFDMVVSCDVLEHVQSIENSVAEIHRVLRNGGLFIGFVPMEGGFRPHALFRLLDSSIYVDTKDHNHSYTRRDLRQLFRRHFEIRSLRYSYHFLGGFMDAAFFASFKLPGIGAKLAEFWRGSENCYYRSVAADHGPSLIGRLVGAANTIAYYESKALHWSPFPACGLHFLLRKCRDD